LPREFDGRPLRHVVEVRHDSFFAPAFVALLREFRTPVVFAEHAVYPAIGDLTGEFVYARLQKGKDSIATGYPLKELDAWAGRVREWTAGGIPADLPCVESAKPEKRPRDAYLYFIHEGKKRAPAAAMELIARLRE